MSFGMAYATKKRNAKCMARGGEVEHPDAVHNAAGTEDADMIARILHKRKEYSKGGMVANDVGVAEADEAPAEFDDLVLRDDLEEHYTAANSGDELGEDAVSRAMKRRKK